MKGFVRPPIGQALAFDALEGFIGAFMVGQLAPIPAEGELVDIALQVLLGKGMESRTSPPKAETQTHLRALSVPDIANIRQRQYFKFILANALQSWAQIQRHSCGEVTWVPGQARDDGERVGSYVPSARGGLSGPIL